MRDLLLFALAVACGICLVIAIERGGTRGDCERPSAKSVEALFFPCGLQQKITRLP